MMIRADIDSNGRVKKAWTHESSGHEVLDKAAIRSVKGWVFTPAQKDGSSVASTVQFPIVFQLR